MDDKVELIKKTLEKMRIQNGKHWPCIELFAHGVGTVTLPVTDEEDKELFVVKLQIVMPEEEKEPIQNSFL